MRDQLESSVRREEQVWPDCGGPSNTFLLPHAVPGGKATQTYSLYNLGLDSSQESTSKNFFRFRAFRAFRVRGL